MDADLKKKIKQASLVVLVAIAALFFISWSDGKSLFEQEKTTEEKMEQIKEETEAFEEYRENSDVFAEVEAAQTTEFEYTFAEVIFDMADAYEDWENQLTRTDQNEFTWLSRLEEEAHSFSLVMRDLRSLNPPEEHTEIYNGFISAGGYYEEGMSLTIEAVKTNNESLIHESSEVFALAEIELRNAHALTENLD